MAGYIGSKAVNLSTTGADINGNANIDGQLSLDTRITVNGGTDFGSIELGGDNGAFIDFKEPLSEDYNGRIIYSDANGFILGGNTNIPVKLAYGGFQSANVKLTTSSSGVDITGVLSSDGLTVDGNISLPQVTPYINAVANLAIDIDSDNNNTGASFHLTHDGATKSIFKAEESGDISFYEDTGTTPKFFWDASAESLGIGTTSPQRAITVSGSQPFIQMDNTATGGEKWELFSGTNALHGVPDGTFVIRNHEGAGNVLHIDSSGNLLVGTTDSLIWNESATDNSKEGVVIEPRSLQISRYQDTQALFNRQGNDGANLVFAKDGTTVGSIGAVGGSTYVSGSTNGVRFLGARVQPCNTSGSLVDNVMDIGFTTSRFDDIYATNGTIQTSDRNEKQDIAELTDAEQRVAVAAKGLLRKFRWRDAVEAKGDDARTHFGIIAQDLQAAFAAEGLDAGDYAMFISTTWWEHDVEVPAVEAVAEVLDEEGNVVTEAVEAVDAYTRTDTYDTREEAPEGATERTRLGVRYSELLAFIIGAL